MKFRLLFITLFICSVALAQNKGTISGVLTDKDSNNATLPFANAMIKGTAIASTTDENGKYAINLDPGDYVIEFSFLGYENVEVPFTIIAGETITINKALGSGSYKLEDVVIKASSSREKETALLLEQKNAVEIKQSIGAQEMTRKGVSDVEEGLTKVTGFTKVDGRGLFVRGLEERYSNILINGLAVPSNSPFKKIVPLDQFPTDIVGFLDIYKTFNPDIYGDFAGGTININTTQPTGEKTKVNYGVGYTTGNNLTHFLSAYDANDTKTFFGFNGKDRELPSAFGSTPSAVTHNTFGSNWNVDEGKSPLNTSFGLTHTGKINVGKDTNTLRYIFSLNFDNKYTVREGVDRTFYPGQNDYDNNLFRSEYKFQTQSSSLFGLNYKANRLKLNSTFLYMKTTENTIQDQIGYTRNSVNNPNQYIRLNQFDQSDYFVSQVYGSYNLTEDQKHSVNGGVSYTKTTFKQPDRKFIDAVKLGENSFETRYGGNHLLRQFLDIDGSYFISSKLEYNLKFGKENTNKLSVGYNGYTTELESNYRFIYSKVPSNGTNSIYVSPLNTIDDLIASSIANNNLAFEEGTNANYKNLFNLNVNSGYFNMLFHLGEKLEFNTGIRAENSVKELKYRTISASISDSFIKDIDKKLYILPSLNVKYVVNDNTNFRLALGQTITRPALAEVLNNQYVEADGTSVLGNPNLVNSENLNLDLKYEFFPSKNEMIAVTLFGKQIKNPIERVIDQSGSGAGQIITFYNNDEATLYGAEIEFLLQLNRLSSTLDNLSFGFNTSLMKTNVTVSNTPERDFDTFRERELQGASNWLINSDLKYEFNFSEKWKNTATLVYGVYGKRIFATGIAGNDHIYEKPFNKLDFVWTNTIDNKWDIKFGVDNILNPVYKKELGDNSLFPIDKSLTLKDYKKGIGFTVNLSYSF